MKTVFFSKESYNFRIVFFVGVVLIHRLVIINAAPPSFHRIRRDASAKTLQVSNVAQVDDDDGEVWYPTIDSDEDESSVDTSNAKETKERRFESEDDGDKSEYEANYDSNAEKEKTSSNYDDWIKAIRELFKKFGFRDDQIPEPFGTKKSSNVDMPSHEFGLILQGLISKTPANLNEQLKDIVHSGGIQELDSTSQDKTSMLTKIGKTVKELQGDLTQKSNHKSEANSHNEIEEDRAREKDHKSETHSHDEEISKSSDTSYDYEEDKEHSKSSDNFKHEEMTLHKDMDEINTIIEQVKSVFDKSHDTQENDVVIAQENLDKLATLVHEVEEIAEKDVSVLQSLPCANEKHSHSDSKEHSSSEDESTFAETPEIIDKHHGESTESEHVQVEPVQDTVKVEHDERNIEIDNKANKIIAELKQIAERERIRHSKHETGERDPKETSLITHVLKDIHDLGEKEKQREMASRHEESEHTAENSAHNNDHHSSNSAASSIVEHHSPNSHVDSHHGHSTSDLNHPHSNAGHSTDSGTGTHEEHSSNTLVNSHVSLEKHASEPSPEKDDMLKQVSEIVEKEVQVTHKANEEHKKHKEEMLNVIRHLKLSETSEEDEERFQKIEHIIEQIDNEHNKEVELEMKLENSIKNSENHNHESHNSENHSHESHSSENHSHENHSGEKHSNENHNSEIHSHDSENHSPESHNSENHSGEHHIHENHSGENHGHENHSGENHNHENHGSEHHGHEKHSHNDHKHENYHNHETKAEEPHIDLERDHNHELSLETLKEKAKENDAKLENHIMPNIAHKWHGTVSRSDSEMENSGEDLENAAEYTEKFHHVKKTRKGAKHHENSVHDSKKMQFADIRDDSLTPYVAKAPIVEATTHGSQKTEDYSNENNQHQQNSDYHHQDNSYATQQREENVYNNYETVAAENTEEEMISGNPRPVASVSFRHTIKNIVPAPKQTNYNMNNEQYNEQPNSQQFVNANSIGNSNLVGTQNYNSEIKDYSGQTQTQHETKSDYSDLNYSDNSSIDENHSGNYGQENSKSESAAAPSETGQYGISYKSDTIKEENEIHGTDDAHETHETSHYHEQGGGTNSAEINFKPDIQDVQGTVVNLQNILKELDNSEDAEHRVEIILDNGPKFAQSSNGLNHNDNNHQFSPEYLDNVIEEERHSGNDHHSEQHHVREHGDAVASKRWRRHAKQVIKKH